MFRSFVLIKPDGVLRGLTGKIISRFENKGFSIQSLKMLVPTKELAEQHYIEHTNKDFYDEITNYISSGPVIAISLESFNEDTVQIVRKMVGDKNPRKAELGTIRGDYGISKYKNIIHAADSNESAKREICLWFKN